MIRKHSTFLLSLLFVAVSAVAPLPIAAQTTTTNTFFGGPDVEIVPVQFNDALTTDTTLTGTPTVINLAANSRQFSSQAFILYNKTASTVVEYAFGGGSLTTCAGDDPVVQIGSSTTYTVNVAGNLQLFSAGGPGQQATIFEIYDTGSGNAVLARFQVLGIDVTNKRLTCRWISGANPENAAADDVVGGPNLYTFTTGDGHLLFAQQSVTLKPPTIRPTLLLRADTGSPVIRLIQSN